MDQLEQRAKDYHNASVDQNIKSTQNSLKDTNNEISQKQAQVNDLQKQKTNLENEQGRTTSNDPNIVSVPGGHADTTKSLLEIIYGQIMILLRVMVMLFHKIFM